MGPSDFTAVGAVGANILFSVVMAWYLLTKAIPELQRKFSEDLALQRVEFFDALKLQREDAKVARDGDQKAMDRLVGVVISGNTEAQRRMEEKIDRQIVLLEELRRKPGGV